MFLQPFVHDPLASTSNEETYLGEDESCKNVSSILLACNKISSYNYTQLCQDMFMCTGSDQC